MLIASAKGRREKKNRGDDLGCILITYGKVEMRIDDYRRRALLPLQSEQRKEILGLS